MLRQFFLPHHPKPAGLASSGSASSVSGRLTSVIGRRWPLWADRIARNNGSASRLMAAVHTDIVGYSRLFTLDDTGTVARLRDLRRNLVAPAIRRHHGQLVQTAGELDADHVRQRHSGGKMRRDDSVRAGTAEQPLAARPPNASARGHRSGRRFRRRIGLPRRRRHHSGSAAGRVPTGRCLRLAGSDTIEAAIGLACVPKLWARSG